LPFPLWCHRAKVRCITDVTVGGTENHGVEEIESLSHLVSEVTPEDGVPVAQRVTRQWVEGKGLPQLLSRPLRGRVRGHVAVENTPTVMGRNQKM
jgi:hypothetical protein